MSINLKKLNRQLKLTTILKNSLGTIKSQANRALTENKIPVNFDQWQLLYSVSQDQGILQSTLDDVLGRDEASINRTIKKLQTEGLITRTKDAKEKRNYKLYLTPKSMDIEQEATKCVQKIMNNRYSKIHDREFHLLVDVLDKINR